MSLANPVLFGRLGTDVVTKILDYTGPDSEYNFKLVSKQTRDAYITSKEDKLKGDDKADPEKLRQARKTETVMGDFVVEGLPLEDGLPTSYEPADDKRVRDRIRRVRADFPIGEEGRSWDIKLLRSIVRARSTSAMRISTDMEGFFHDNGWTHVPYGGLDEALVMVYQHKELIAVTEVAAELGDVTMMGWLLNAKSTGFSMNAGNALYDNGLYEPVYDSASAAASKGHIHMLDYLNTHDEFDAHEDHCLAAITNGQLGPLQWYLDGPGNMQPSRNMLSEAVSCTKKEIVHYLLHEKGMTPDRDMVLDTVDYFGNSEVVQWMVQAAGEQTSGAAMLKAVQDGAEDKTSILHERGCSWATRTSNTFGRKDGVWVSECPTAAADGDLSMLKRLVLDHHAPFHETVEAALANGYVSIAEWAKNQGAIVCTAETMARRGHPKFHLKNVSRRSEARARWGEDSITWANEFFTETNDPVYDTSVDDDDEDDDEEEYRRAE